MEISPVITKKAYQSITEQFIGLINRGELGVGEKLPPERTLAGMFSVGRSSIREAFRVMEIIGLIEVRPGGGTYVTDLNIEAFLGTLAPLFIKNGHMEDDLLDFRKMVELEAVRLAAGKNASAGKTANGKKPPVSHKSLADCTNICMQLEKSIDMMKKSIKLNDPSMGVEADILFHKNIIALAGNCIMSKAMECVSFILESSIKFNREKILKNKKNARVLLNQHMAIYEAVRLQDPELAAKIMEENLNFVRTVG